ncbi:MAG: SDR family NAD(P)-dependent oxidoreductase [Parvibaculales bacterium]
MKGLKNKRILLTGANGCLGRAIAERLSAEGCQLALVDKSGVDQPPKDALVIWADISDAAAVETAFSNLRSKLGGLDGLVNLAAVLDQDDGGTAETSREVFEKTLSTNLLGTFLTCQAAITMMRDEGAGAIVNFSSVVAHAASASAQIAYTSAKGGVEALTREIAIEQARHGIRANCIAPGPVLSDRNKHYFNTPEKWQTRRRHIPMGRLGTPEEIAGSAAFLLSEDAGYITGTTLLCDGGIANAYVVDDSHGGAPAP